MIDTRLLELQARQLEGLELTGPELFELEDACRQGGHMARLLQSDRQMHAELLLLHQIDSTTDQFVHRCLAAIYSDRVMDRAAGSVSEFTAPSGVQLNVGDRIERFRRRQTGKQAVARFRSAAWISITAAIVLVGIAGWRWFPRRTGGSAIEGNSRMADSRQSIAERSGTRGKPLDEVDQPAFADVRIESKSGMDSSERLVAGDKTIPADRSETDRSPGTEVVDSGMPALQYTPGSIWEHRPDAGDSFPVRYGLRSGFAELVLDDGTHLVLRGPASITLESPDQMLVEQGEVRVDSVSSATPLSIVTPTVTLNGRDEWLAYLNVRSDQGTLVRLEHGQLTANPWHAESETELLLSENGLDHGVFGPAWSNSSIEPASAIAINSAGQFQGVVKAAERPLKTTSPVVFAQLMDVSRSMIRDDRQTFPEQWKGMVDGLERAVGKMDVRIDDQTIRPRTAEELIDQFANIRQRMTAGKGIAGGFGSGNSQQDSAFSGVININGRERRFSTPDEFQIAQNEIFGPLFERMMPGLHQPSGGQQFMTLPVDPFGNGSLQENNSSSSVFSGMINNNGDVMEFTSPEGFSRALRQFNNRRQATGF